VEQRKLDCKRILVHLCTAEIASSNTIYRLLQFFPEEVAQNSLTIPWVFQVLHVCAHPNSALLAHPPEPLVRSIQLEVWPKSEERSSKLARRCVVEVIINSLHYNLLLLFLLTFQQPLLPSSEQLSTRCRCGGQ